MILASTLFPWVPISVEGIQMRHAECSKEDTVDGKGKESSLLGIRVGQDNRHHCFDDVFVGSLHAVSTGSRIAFPRRKTGPFGLPFWRRQW